MGTIKQWPASERPRERLIARGEEALSEADLLALVMGTGSQGESALELAAGLLTRFGGLRGLTTAPLFEIVKQRGMGLAKACLVKAAVELGKRVVAERPAFRSALRCSEEVFKGYNPLFKDLKREAFYVVLLDSRNRGIREVKVAEGSLNGCGLNPRDVFSPAVRESAAAVIFIHNHPSGDPAPSKEDIELTSRLSKAGDLLGVRVLDHIIIGDGRYTSLVDMGYLK